MDECGCPSSNHSFSKVHSFLFPRTFPPYFLPAAMSLLYWNIRGGCSTLRQRELKKHLTERNVEISGILESKATIERFNEAKVVLGDEWEMIRNQGGYTFYFTAVYGDCNPSIRRQLRDEVVYIKANMDEEEWKSASLRRGTGRVSLIKLAQGVQLGHARPNPTGTGGGPIHLVQWVRN